MVWVSKGVLKEAHTQASNSKAGGSFTPNMFKAVDTYKHAYSMHTYAHTLFFKLVGDLLNRLHEPWCPEPGAGSVTQQPRQLGSWLSPRLPHLPTAGLLWELSCPSKC